MAFDLSQYETVEDRLLKFWADHPDGRVATVMMNYDGDSCVFRADIYYSHDAALATASGYAHEVQGSSPVNRTSFVENCETSSIGRALANCGYATHGKRPSRTEMEKVARQEPIVTSSTNERGDVTVRTQYLRPMQSTSLASPKQKGFIRKLAGDRDLKGAEMLEVMRGICDDDTLDMDNMSVTQASAVINAWKVQE